MADLYANVDGQMVPLADCTWVIAYRCGHPYGLMAAQVPGSTTRDVYATEEAAWREMHPRARDRQARQREGVTARLATRATLDDEFWQRFKDGHEQAGCDCEQGAKR